MKYSNEPDKVQNVLKKLNETHVVNKNLHEIKNEILEDYVGEFEMVGRIKIGDRIRETHIRFRSITEYEAYTKLLFKIVSLKMLFSMVIFIKTTLLNLT